MNFILAPSATRDLDQLSEYYFNTNIEAGEKLFTLLNQRFEQLTKFPHLGKPYPHLDPSIRGLIAGKHIIFYRVTQYQVEIVRIVQGQQDLTKLFNAN
jgi:toxin ParE1/3/4